MSAGCSAGRHGTLDPVGRQVDSLRERYQLLAVSCTTPTQKAEIARIGMKLAELLHLTLFHQETHREAAAIPLLTDWIAGRSDSFEEQRRVRSLFVPRPC